MQECALSSIFRVASDPAAEVNKLVPKKLTRSTTDDTQTAINRVVPRRFLKRFLEDVCYITNVTSARQLDVTCGNIGIAWQPGQWHFLLFVVSRVV